VTVVGKNKAVVCCLLATSAIMLSGKRTDSVKCGKKCHLERNISCDVYLLNGLIGTDVEVECLEMMASWCWQVN
jgi:hypothetical protein